MNTPAPHLPLALWQEKISQEREIIKKEPERGSGAEGLREGNAKCAESTTSRTDHTEEGSVS